MKIKRMGFGFTRGDSRLSGLIALLTAPWRWRLLPSKLREVCSHAFVWFERDDGKMVYFEALIDQDLVGPRPVEKVIGWAAEKPARWVRFFDLSWGLRAGTLTKAYEFCLIQLGRWTYDKRQLRLMPRTNVLGRLLVGPTPNAVICSEAVARIVYVASKGEVDFRRMTNRKEFDWIAPWPLMAASERWVFAAEVTAEILCKHKPKEDGL